MENTVANISNILLFLENKTEELENKIALGKKTHLGWQELTFKGVSILAKRLAAYLVKIGVDKGDKLVILSESMPEWGAALFASVMAGATTIPLDIKLTTWEMTSILESCKPKVIVVSTTYLDKALELKEKISSVEHIILINETSTHKDFVSLYDIEDMPEPKWRHRSVGKTAFIIYTSGTTGSPKGVEITFKNVMAQVYGVGQSFNLSTKDQLLSILPMNHLFELTVGFLSFLNMGTSIYYSQSLKPKDLFSILKAKSITFMVVVPAFLKLLKATIENEVSQSGFFKRSMFHILFNISKYIPFYPIRKLIFRDIHKKFGGKFKGAISGGAPLDIEVCAFFQTIGIKVYEGYGLSEASPVVSVNTDKASRLGSVGKPLPGVEVKTDPTTGELLVRGANVMKGYYGQDELTKETITEDGWLHTGDIAKIDNDGYIFITGRIKNMIVLSGGKKVFPEEVESVIALNPNFAESCVFGVKRVGGQKDGTEDICAIVVPKENVLKQNMSDEELLDFARNEVKLSCQRLSAFKRPVSVFVSKESLPKTATSKVKRKEIAALYSR